MTKLPYLRMLDKGCTMVSKKFHNGVQKIYTFGNGYKVSVICHDGSYGGPYLKGGIRNPDNRWEIAPMDSAGNFIGQSQLGWGDDVMGHLPWLKVMVKLEEIACLN